MTGVWGDGEGESELGWATRCLWGHQEQSWERQFTDTTAEAEGMFVPFIRRQLTNLSPS